MKRNVKRQAPASWERRGQWGWKWRKLRLRPMQMAMGVYRAHHAIADIVENLGAMEVNVLKPRPFPT
jgi:hypothetical protein